MRHDPAKSCWLTRPHTVLVGVAILVLVACGGETRSPRTSSASLESIPASIAETAARLRDEALRESRAYDLVASLTTEVGPRFAASPGDRKAVAWARNTMQSLGLDNVRAEPVDVPYWVRGVERGEILEPYRQPVTLAALGGTVGTGEEGVEAEVVEAASLEALDGMPREQVEGKIVFFNQRMRRTRDGSGYGEVILVRVFGAARAAGKGAAAVLIRSIGTSSNRLAHTGGMRYSDDVVKIPAAALSNPDADLLERQLASGQPVRFRLKLGSHLVGEAGERTSANVIGEVVGREKPEEIVFLTAHLDSWDLGQGAVDNGAGCAVITETARILSELPTPPRRTVRVMLSANEEFGLSGARAYVAKHADELDRHVVGLECDFGAGGIWALRSRLPEERLAVARDLAQLLAPLGIEHQGNTATGGADLSRFFPYGLPMFDLRIDGTDYFDIHHSANDTLDKIDPEKLRQMVAAFVTVTYVAAELEDDLGRVAPEEPPF